MAVADVLNPDFYVLSFIKLMEDELEERRKSSRRELFRNNDCQKELFVRLSHSHLCGFNRCLESRISQQDECCACRVHSHISSLLLASFINKIKRQLLVFICA